MSAPSPDPASDCPFCHPDALNGILSETERFFVLADHAPLIDGHTLIIPKRHYPCYGALPPELDDELAKLKRHVMEFLGAAYRAPVFFEHGVFRQTVFHAHLHAMPFGPVDFGVQSLAAAEGHPVQTQADIRGWYARRGNYFYIEQPPIGDIPAQAAVFPPDMGVYFRVLGALREATGRDGRWAPPAERYAAAKPKLQALASAWQRFSTQE